MGKKPTGKGKYICILIANLLIFSSVSCSYLEGKREEAVVEPKIIEPKIIEPIITEPEIPEIKEIVVPTKEEKEAERLKALLDTAKNLMAQGDFEGSLRENQKVIEISGKKPPGDAALFNMGLIYSHYGNPNKDYKRSLDFFNKLLDDYPDSPLSEQAKIWIGVLKVIEESKKVDIEIEQKKKELLK